jgi:DNA-binding IclR family transcriptional regulator
LADAERASGVEADIGTSVGKALALLSAFGTDDALGVTELARRTGLSKSTAHRLLAVLEQWSLVDRQGAQYCLGTRLFELGNQVAHRRAPSLRDVALPYLEDLYELTHETVHLAVLDRTDVLYVEKLYGHNYATSPSKIGGRMPAYCAGLGKAILAFSSPALVRQVIAEGLRARTPYTIVVPSLLIEELQEIRRAGVAFDREEVILGLTCIAAPVLDADGNAIAAISVSGATRRFDPRPMARAVREAADAVGRQLSTP